MRRVYGVAVYPLLNFCQGIVSDKIMNMITGQNAHEIVPGLWLGNRGASQDTYWMRHNNIQSVFNCTKDLPFSSLPLRFYRVPVDDNLQEEEIRNMELWAPEIVMKLTREYNTGYPVLVHCFAGMQRSAAVVAMFLIAKYRCSTDEAIAYIRQRRPIAFQSAPNFYDAILGFEKTFHRWAMQSNKASSLQKIPFPLM